MCGILGVVSLKGPLDASAYKSLRMPFEKLLRTSESRGREASGAVWLTPSEIATYKEARTASLMLASPGYQSAWSRLAQGQPVQAVLGHSRLATHGSERLNVHNQPVSGRGCTVLHNGIVTNTQALWSVIGAAPQTELDTEVIPALLHHLEADAPAGGMSAALARFGAMVEGTVSIAFTVLDRDCVYLYTNNGSLYWCRIGGGSLLAFASEARILCDALKIGIDQTSHVVAGDMVAIDLAAGTMVSGTPGNGMVPDCRKRATPRVLREIASPQAAATDAKAPAPDVHVRQGWSRFEIQWEQIARLRRCAKGTLPETMPFISFDADGVSNYARNHVPYRPRGEQALQHEIERHAKSHGKRCLVAFSGGRDSSFALHYLKRAGMDPVAYTYDWGMVTDLARRNQARLCGKLGIEHIIVSADIRAKRDNIRRNVLAWLDKPHLGTVPLFMAGDKQYFYHANRLRKSLGLHWVVLAANPLERTNFKSGFAGVPPNFANRPPMGDKARLLGFYAAQFLGNPGYLNRSLIDTVSAYLSFYAIPHDYLRIFDYVRWNEQQLDAELQADFGWERATDTKTTWRIGDGTAAFYNYIFMQVAGFTENDTLRNNQVLEGDIARDAALELILRDNAPRFESIEWYCRTIGIDPIAALDRIVSIPRKYGR